MAANAQKISPQRQRLSAQPRCSKPERLDILVDMVHARSIRHSSRRYVKPRFLTCLVLAFAGSGLLSGCNHAAARSTAQVPSAKQMDTARQQLELIPPPSKTRYLAVHSLSSWDNPYVTVQQDMVTLHVTLADANTTDLGVGGMLRPVGARQQVLNVRNSDLPEALDAIPENSWPYGRVVAVEEAHNIPATDRPAVRRNVESTMKTLSDLGVVVYEWNDTTAGLR